jgi:CBS domain-containing protein
MLALVVPPMRLADVMTSTVVTAEPDMPVRGVAELMRERNVGSVVLVEGGRPVGVITDRDLAINVLADGRGADDPARGYASAPVVTGTLDMEVDEAGELMVTHGIRRLPVLDGDRLIGIVTLDDLVVRTGNAHFAHDLTTQITRASMPEFYFHQRGG